jgi:hypothetical protein
MAEEVRPDMDVVAAAPGPVGLGLPDAAAGVPLTGGAQVTGAGATGAAWDTGTRADGAGVTQLDYGMKARELELKQPFYEEIQMLVSIIVCFLDAFFCTCICSINVRTM